ncbi:hypothetical protein BDN72DRAFT_965064 [Pluteus cervinus]|uniref:Uncharacterized protein n=1 Tax=Pluteus cervinus TaxID=181527 RepID=A0ACD3A7K9_9AGAR|nr:hypothetical protein BDN72DRAFT_965064 [Pluteus cervinus]
MKVVFPLELERNILEICAQTDLDYAPTLLRVSRYVLTWIRPVIYEVLTMYCYGRQSPSREAVKAHGRHVRNLLIGPQTNEDRINACLLSCPNVVNLALWYAPRLSTRNRELLHRLPLVRLSMHLQSILNADYVAPNLMEGGTPQAPKEVIEFLSLFPRVTHFDMLGGVPFEIPPCIQVLPSLSFLSLPHALENRSGFEPLQVVLKRNPQLKLILLLLVDHEADDYADKVDAMIEGMASEDTEFC